MTTETPADEAETGVPSISDILAGNSSSTHDGHREVGQPTEPDGVPSSSAQPAPTAETPPAAVPASTAAPAAAVDPATDPKSPRWFREHIQKTNRELAQTRAELERARGAPPQQPAQPRQAPVTLPNPVDDPNGYHEAVTRGFTSQMQQFQLQTTLNLSERFARQQHGVEAFEDCKSWLTTRPDLEAHFLQQPDPWGTAFSYYSREKLAEEIGDDPNAWRERERQRIREEVLAEGQRNTPAPAPAPTMRANPPLPASTARSSAPGRDASGRFAGPQPIGALSKHKFG